jgi:hypothetical protein
MPLAQVSRARGSFQCAVGHRVGEDFVIDLVEDGSAGGYRRLLRTCGER